MYPATSAAASKLRMIEPRSSKTPKDLEGLPTPDGLVPTPKPLSEKGPISAASLHAELRSMDGLLDLTESLPVPEELEDVSSLWAAQTLAALDLPDQMAASINSFKKGEYAAAVQQAARSSATGLEALGSTSRCAETLGSHHHAVSAAVDGVAGEVLGVLSVVDLANNVAALRRAVTGGQIEEIAKQSTKIASDSSRIARVALMGAVLQKAGHLLTPLHALGPVSGALGALLDFFQYHHEDGRLLQMARLLDQLEEAAAARDLDPEVSRMLQYRIKNAQEAFQSALLSRSHAASEGTIDLLTAGCGALALALGPAGPPFAIITLLLGVATTGLKIYRRAGHYAQGLKHLAATVETTGRAQYRRATKISTMASDFASRAKFGALPVAKARFVAACDEARITEDRPVLLPAGEVGSALRRIADRGATAGATENDETTQEQEQKTAEKVPPEGFAPAAESILNAAETQFLLGLAESAPEYFEVLSTFVQTATGTNAEQAVAQILLASMHELSAALAVRRVSLGKNKLDGFSGAVMRDSGLATQRKARIWKNWAKLDRTQRARIADVQLNESEHQERRALGGSLMDVRSRRFIARDFWQCLHAEEMTKTQRNERINTMVDLGAFEDPVAVRRILKSAPDGPNAPMRIQRLHNLFTQQPKNQGLKAVRALMELQGAEPCTDRLIHGK